MGMNFPNPPLTIGQQFAGYTWDGEKWLAPTPSGGGVSEAPNDALMYGRKSLTWQRAVAVAGDTMTGVLTVASGSLVIQSASFPSLYIADTSGKQFRQFSAFNRYYLQNSTDAVSLLEATGATLATSSVVIPGTTPTSNATSGALIVSGGVGIAGSLCLAGATLSESAGTITVQGPTNFMFGGTTSWINYGSATGAATLMFNGSGTKSLGYDGVGALVMNGAPLVITNGAVSTTPTTGALIVGGGVGISGRLSLPSSPMVLCVGAAPASNAAVGIRHDPAAFPGLEISSSSAGTAASILAVWNNGYANTWAWSWAASQVAINVSGQWRYTDVTTSTSTSTGALAVAGGVGIVKDLYVGGLISCSNVLYAGGGNIYVLGSGAPQINFYPSTGSTQSFVIYQTGNSATFGVGGVGSIVDIALGASAATHSFDIKGTKASTSSTTGALTVAGGLGVEKDVFVGGQVIATGPFATGLTQSIANGASGAAMATSRGVVILSENTTFGHVAMYIFGQGVVVMVSASHVSGAWVAPTTTPAAGKCSFAYDGVGSFKIYNNMGGTTAFAVTQLKCT